MGGGGPTAEYQQSATRNILDPRVAGLLFPQLSGLAQQQEQFGQQAQNIAGQMQTSFQPQAFQGPDDVTRAQIALGEQALLNQAAANRAGIARGLGAQPGASQVLQRMAGIQAGVQRNPLLFSAMQQQTEREAMANQQRMQAQQAGNAALLQQLATYQAPIQSAIQGFQPLLGAAGVTGSQEQFAMKGEGRQRAVQNQYNQFLAKS